MPKVNNKEQIKQYLLKLIANGSASYAGKTAETFGIARSTVYNYIGELRNDGVLEADAAGHLRLTEKEYVFDYRNSALTEDRVFERDIKALITDFPKNVQSVWQYAFTEMMNNAIEHSAAQTIRVTVRVGGYDTAVTISDDGIGIFRNIRDYWLREKKEELTLHECASLLFAGKLTTAREMHSGEGIFFTSHLMDSFYILSDDVVFSRDNFDDFILTGLGEGHGTTVRMTLHNASKKTVNEVFDRFSDIEHGFYRTHIPIAHIFPGGSPVSRSEARRLGEMIADFGRITLDFTDVPEIGQAFTHELFVVWQKRHPDTVLDVVNADKAVGFMIGRVLNTK